MENTGIKKQKKGNADGLKGVGKFISTVTVCVIVLFGLIIVAINPERAETYQTVVMAMSPIVLGHMGAIFGGNLVKKKYENGNDYEEGVH